MKPKKKGPGRPVSRDWTKVPAAAQGISKGKTRKTYVIKEETIADLEAMAAADNILIGEELEISVEERKQRLKKIRKIIVCGEVRLGRVW